MSSVSDPVAAKTIQTILKDLSKNLKKVESVRKTAEAGVELLNSQHAEVEGEGVLSVAAQSKLLKSYQQSIIDADKEEEEIR